MARIKPEPREPIAYQRFDLKELRRAAELARREIATWPEWKRRAADAVHRIGRTEDQ